MTQRRTTWIALSLSAAALVGLLYAQAATLQLVTIRGRKVLVRSDAPTVPVEDLTREGGELVASTAKSLLELSDRTADVKLHGAIGDGTTDDTAAIAAAHAYAGANGTVYYPKGTYLVTQATANSRVFNLTSAGQSHLAEPGTVIKLKSDAASGTAIFWLNGADQLIRGLTFDINGVTNAAGIHPRTSSVRGKITGCTFKGSAATGGIGISMSGNATDLSVTNNHFYGCAYGIISSASASPARVVIANNVLDGNGIAVGNAISINSPTGSAADIVVTGNLASGWTSTQVVIGFAHVARGTISGNLVRNCTGPGIHVEDGTTDTAITGNTVSQCGGAGIECVWGATNLTRRISIVGNTVESCLLTAPTVGAINVNGLHEAEDVIVAHNIVRGCGLVSTPCFGIALFAKNSRVIGNIVSNTTGTTTAGIKLFAGSGNLVAHNRCYDDQGSPTQDHGLIVAGNQTNVQVFDNCFVGNGTGGIDEGGIGTQTNYSKRDNLPVLP